MPIFIGPGEVRGFVLAEYIQRQRSSGSTQRAVAQELRYLKDPLKLADRIRIILYEGDSAKAEEIVGVASKDMKCTVAWNHLVDHQIGKGKVSRGLKIYNDMKKRGQTPDAYTYGILLRGLGTYVEYPQSLGKALSIYHSMFAPNSPVKPTIVHTNAVLKVCARAKDMDSLWGIAAKLPERGLGAPDSLTWTTILNALSQSHASESSSSDLGEQRARQRNRAILDGRRIWDDVIGKWRKGDIWIDEQLVCAMGRLLLIGSCPRDWDDVLSLVEQTMRISRLLPRLGTDVRIDNSLPRQQSQTVQSPEENGLSLVAGGEFDPIEMHHPVGRKGQSHSTAYARPGRNTLSLVIDACVRMGSQQAARDYWELLTENASYNIRPDLDNLNTYLRCLRVGRASKEAVELMATKMSAPGFTMPRKSFRIVMSTCFRDKNNPNAFAHAGRLLDLMQRGLEQPDIRTMIIYLDLAISRGNGGDILMALHRLGPGIVNLRSLLAYGVAESGSKLAPQDKFDVMNLLRKMVSSYDRLMKKGEVRRENYMSYAKERSKLAALITRYSVVDKGKALEAANARRDGLKGKYSDPKFDELSIVA
ncbi:MAG: hypothetical protein M1827_005890 [Pycnora praestabilis]|nr:MAG: hypothetical protein M1827_005890 [Pycnora praestabilis]